MKAHVFIFIRSCLVTGFLMLFFASLYSQPYQINFTGSGLSTTVATVEVQNLTQETTLTLNGTDILELVSVIGTGDILRDEDDNLLEIWPNPTPGECRIRFYNPEEGGVIVEISDLSGKKLLKEAERMPRGYVSFRIESLPAGLCILRIITLKNQYYSKVISSGFCKANPVMLNFSPVPEPMASMKLSNTTAVIQMQYNAGERLLFKGTSGIYSRVLTLVPIQSQAVNFEFIDCTDGDGTHYPVVTIESQTWMAENLRTTKYYSGNPIIYILDPYTWCTSNIPAYCWYNNDSVMFAYAYGALYNWYAADNPDLCPVGWHVPGNSEWDVLVGFFGGQGPAGSYLKEVGFLYWNSPNTGATNATGFSARAGGYRSEASGGFYEYGTNGRWWESLDTGMVGCCGSWIMAYNQTYTYWNGVPKLWGNSVRCIKD